MNTIENVLFHNEASTPETSTAIGNPNLGSQITIEVSGADELSLKVQGFCYGSEDDDNWTDLAVIDASSLSIKPDITKPGIYFVGIDGVTKIRTDLESVTGEVTVYGSIKG